MKKNTLTHLFLVVLAILALSSIAAGGGKTFVTTLSGAAEVPPGDPDGSGTAHITIYRGQRMVCWHIQVSNITLPATGAHIHAAPAGSAGGVVVPLSAPDVTGSSSGCTEGVSRALLKDIIKNPEGYYVNVHNADYSPGAVRGQLSD